MEKRQTAQSVNALPINRQNVSTKIIADASESVHKIGLQRKRRGQFAEAKLDGHFDRSELADKLVMLFQ